jgi:gamma-glutamyltranspeptidase / glutathione hydrolase
MSGHGTIARVRATMRMARGDVGTGVAMVMRRACAGTAASRRVAAALALLLGVVAIAFASPNGAVAQGPSVPPRQAVAVGTGGAAATVDPLASQAAIRVLDQGGNAVDAAVAAAAVLGATEPYTCGIGGGGFMVIYRAADERVVTLDARETAPQAFREDSFIDPATGQPIPFDERVTSGLGVGVPGTLLSWDVAQRRFGTMNLARVLAPAIRIAARGFTVDQVHHNQTLENRDRFRDFPASRELFLTAAGDAPPVGSTVRNPDLADTYDLIADEGVDALYGGDIGEAVVETVQHPPVAAGTTRNVRPGLMTLDDLDQYETVDRPPTVVSYRGLEVYGMGPPSSGGSTVGETLNILEGFDLAGSRRVTALHYFLEASALAFADRGRYIGDSDFVDVPLAGLLSDSFAAERRALIGATAAPKPVPPGDPTDNDGPSTTHVTVADRFGNVVSHTFTIESTGGSAMTVPGHGLLLNNELTDFEAGPGFPNSPAGGKRPRSSMSPTIVLSDGKPVVALGFLGGPGTAAITSVVQTLLYDLDFDMSLPDALAAPRVSQRNGVNTFAEPAFLSSREAARLAKLGHQLVLTPSQAGTTNEIGAMTGIAFLRGGLLQAVAEPVRRGGGSAMVVEPSG